MHAVPKTNSALVQVSILFRKIFQLISSKHDLVRAASESTLADLRDAPLFLVLRKSNKRTFLARLCWVQMSLILLLLHRTCHRSRLCLSTFSPSRRSSPSIFMAPPGQRWPVASYLGVLGQEVLGKNAMDKFTKRITSRSSTSVRRARWHFFRPICHSIGTCTIQAILIRTPVEALYSICLLWRADCVV